jgi:hypothetical protein
MKTTLKTVILRSLAGLGLAVAITSFVAVRTAPTRQAVSTYTALLAAANMQKVEAAEALCTARYLATHKLRPAPDGGLVGLPRNIHTNFQVWRSGSNVWLCPTNRVGPVYQFVPEGGSWRFDGPVGLLMPGGTVTPLADAADDETVEDRDPSP